MDEPALMRSYRFNQVSSNLSHLAFYPAMYTLGVYLLALLALHLPIPNTGTIAFILLVANACYLLDRVKLTDARQDPADAIALPNRALFCARHAKFIRALIALELIIAIAFGFIISPVLALIPLGALIGVYAYAGRAATPGRARLKDLPALKSFFISSAHLALVVAVLWGNEHDLIAHPRINVLWSLSAIWLIVSADAILCDLDDVDSDALYQTRSLPVLMGVSRAWRLAIVLMLVGTACLFITSTETLALSVVSTLIVFSVLFTHGMKNRRDLVDARLLPIVLIGLMMR